MIRTIEFQIRLKVFGSGTWFDDRQKLLRKILQVSPKDFDEVAMEVFRYQAAHNSVYRSFISLLGTDPLRPQRLTEIPFLPVQLFKSHSIRTGHTQLPEVVFESSGTTGQLPGRHGLYDEGLYKDISTRIFQRHFGSLAHFHILALLPSYLERNNSSLVYMVKHFIEETCSPFSGFYLHNHEEMTSALRAIAERRDGRKVLVLGVTFALLDWAESGHDFSFLRGWGDFHIMETGGMKGRRTEMLREEVHDILRSRLGVKNVMSEYGMTELISQAYSLSDGEFLTIDTMKVLLRDPNDPFEIHEHRNDAFRGGINVVDLGNLDSCAFVETQDLGSFGPTAERFHVIGRFDHSDIRGCNLMVST